MPLLRGADREIQELGQTICWGLAMGPQQVYASVIFNCQRAGTRIRLAEPRAVPANHTMLADTTLRLRFRPRAIPAAWTASARAQNRSAWCFSFFSVS